MMNMETYTAHHYLKSQFAHVGREDDYLRVQTISVLGMDKVDDESVTGLKADGLKLY